MVVLTSLFLTMNLFLIKKQPSGGKAVLGEVIHKHTYISIIKNSLHYVNSDKYINCKEGREVYVNR